MFYSCIASTSDKLHACSIVNHACKLYHILLPKMLPKISFLYYTFSVSVSSTDKLSAMHSPHAAPILPPTSLHGNLPPPPFGFPPPFPGAPPANDQSLAAAMAAAMFGGGGGLPTLPPPQHGFPHLPPPGMGLGPTGMPEGMHPPFPGNYLLCGEYDVSCNHILSVINTLNF